MKTKRLDRVFFHYEELEEVAAGMWRVARGEERKAYINAAASLMRDAQEFKLAMRQAVQEWPKSCLHNLSVIAANRLAWLGHAGTCIATQSPEECTRAAWYLLDDEERNEANRVAAEVVAEWESKAESAQGILL